MRHLLIALILGLSAHRPDVTLVMRPSFLFPGSEVRLQIRIRYADSDRWIQVDWDPDTVGNSRWPVSPSDRSSWEIWRRLDRPGVYSARASVGHGSTIRASAIEHVTVKGDEF